MGFSARRWPASRRVVVFALVAVTAVGFAVFLVWSLSEAERKPEITSIATGLENPRGVAVMPDGRLVVVEAGKSVFLRLRIVEHFDDLA